MKIRIDLLPESRKLLIAKKKRFKNLIKQEVFFFIPVVLIVFVLIGMSYILEFKNEEMRVSCEFQNNNKDYGDFKSYEDKTKRLNEGAATVKKFKEMHFYWSDVIKKLVDITPSGISLNDLSTKNYQVFLVGKASQREVLIDFKEKIGSSDCFESVNMPLSNLVTREDIDFQMDFYIKKDCLITK